MALSENEKAQLKEVLSEYENFNESVIGTLDAVSQVLRFHALTEYYLEKIIELMLPNGHVIGSDSRFSYHHKLKIITAVNVLESGLIGSLRKLSKLRNEFAHHKSPVVVLEEIDEIAKPLGKRYLALVA